MTEKDEKELMSLARMWHDVMPELVQRLRDIDEAQERAELRHVLHAREVLRAKLLELDARSVPVVDEALLDAAVERWRLGEVSVAGLLREWEREEEQGQTRTDTDGHGQEEVVVKPQLKSMWLADYDAEKQLARWTTLTLFGKRTAAERHDIVERLLAACPGANCIPLYALNWGDFAHTPDREVYYTHNLKDDWQEWVRHFRAKNLEPVFVMRNDDAQHPHFSRDSAVALEQLKAYWEQLIVDVLEPLQVRYLIVGLEALEYMNEVECDEAGSWLAARCPWAEVGMHTLKRDTRMLGRPWCRGIWWQGEFWASPEALVADLGALRNQWPDKRIYAFEYSMEGTSAAARAIGNAALAWGADGVMNGFGEVLDNTDGPGQTGTDTGGETPAVDGRWMAEPGYQPWDIGAGVKVLGPVDAGVLGWRESIVLKGVEVFGGMIRFPYSKVGPWDAARQPDGSTSTGNLWVIQEVRGQLYATTIDWLRNSGQQAKMFPGVMQGPGHLVAPMQLVSGECYGFFVSTCARNDLRTTNERSNVVWVKLKKG